MDLELDHICLLHTLTMRTLLHFETMIEDIKNNTWLGFQRRYKTIDEVIQVDKAI